MNAAARTMALAKAAASAGWPLIQDFLANQPPIR